jgi:prolyl oligopeptidase
MSWALPEMCPRISRVFLAVACLPFLSWAQAPTFPPPTRAESLVETILGVKVADPYRWLEDGQSPETRAWIQAQVEYTKSQLQNRPGREELAKRLADLVRIPTTQSGLVRGNRYFFLSKTAGKELPAIYMRTGAHSQDTLLIDPNSWSADHSETTDLITASPDGTLVAYGVRQGGQDQLAIRFFDVDHRRNIADELPHARYLYWTTAIAPGNQGVYYSKFLPEGSRVFYHRFGTDVAHDQLIFGAGLGPDKLVLLHLADDGNLMTFDVLHGAAGRTDVYVKDLRTNAPAVSLVKNIAATFYAQAIHDTIVIQTNWKAPRGRICVTNMQHLSPVEWKDLVPQKDGVVQGFRLVGGDLLVQYSEDAHSRLALFNLEGKPLNEIPLPALGTTTTIDGTWDGQSVAFTFTSFRLPSSLYSYSLSDHRVTQLSPPNAPESLRDVQVEQIWYTSRDGTRVPMFLVHKPGIKRDGNTPTLLHGYGGFDWAQQPDFSPEVALWLERGGLYAVANIRGGSEFGEEWHHAGMFGRKQNVFDDFIAAAEWLIHNRYTSSGKLAIQGMSNGGLLVTAALTQRPELFRAVVARYPLIDMIRYQKFSIAGWWVSEYGSSDNPEQFRYLYAYSPYHHVTQGTRYPAVLLVSGDGDTRVDPLHARKMTAMLQAKSGARDHPVLLLYDTKSGHSGVLSATREAEQMRDELTFLFWQLDVE